MLFTLLFFIQSKCDVKYCVVYDGFPREECPINYEYINSYSEIKESEITGDTIHLYIINDKLHSFAINIDSYKKTKFEISGNSKSYLKLLGLKSNTDLILSGISVYSDLQLWNIHSINFRQLILTQNSLNCSSLDSDLYSLSSFNSITTEMLEIDLTEESYYPISNITIQISNLYTLKGFALTAFLTFGNQRDTLTFSNNSNIVNIQKDFYSQNNITVELTNPKDTIYVSCKTPKVPFLLVNIYLGSEFTIPTYLQSLSDTDFKIQIYDNCTLNINKFGKNGEIEIFNATVKMNLISNDPKISMLTIKGKSSLVIDTTLETPEDIIFDIILATFTIYGPNFEIRNLKEIIKVQFEYLSIDSLLKDPKINFLSQSPYYIEQSLEFYSGDTFIESLNVGESFQMAYMFTMEKFGRIHFGSFQKTSSSLINIYLSYNNSIGIPTDDLVEPFINNPYKIIDFGGSINNEIKIQFSDNCNVPGFCDEYPFMETIYQKENGTISFYMKYYPTIVDSHIWFGDNCNDEYYYVINENNFSLWRNRFINYTHSFTIYLTKTMPNDLCFNFSGIEQQFILIIKSNNNYQVNVITDDNEHGSEIYQIYYLIISNAVLNIIPYDYNNNNKLFGPDIGWIYMYNYSTFTKETFEKCDFTQISIQSDIYSLSNLQKNDISQMKIWLYLNEEFIKIDFLANEWLLSLNGFQVYTNVTRYSLVSNSFEISCNGNDYKQIEIYPNHIDYEEPEEITIKVSGDWSKGKKFAMEFVPNAKNRFIIETSSNIIPINLAFNCPKEISIISTRNDLNEINFPYSVNISKEVSFATRESTYKIENIHFNNFLISSFLVYNIRFYQTSKFNTDEIELKVGSEINIENINVNDKIIFEYASYSLFSKSNLDNTTVIFNAGVKGMGRIDFSNSTLPKAFNIYFDYYKDMNQLIIKGFHENCDEVLNRIYLFNNTIINETKDIKIKLRK